MNLATYMKQLESLVKIAKKLEDEINSYVKIFYHGDYWTMQVIPDSDLNAMSYTRDFDTVEELAKHIDSMYCGAVLANGKEL